MNDQAQFLKLMGRVFARCQQELEIFGEVTVQADAATHRRCYVSLNEYELALDYEVETPLPLYLHISEAQWDDTLMLGFNLAGDDPLTGVCLVEKIDKSNLDRRLRELNTRLHKGMSFTQVLVQIQAWGKDQDSQ